MSASKRSAAGSPLEWIAAAAGALIAIALLGLIGWDAATGPPAEPPAIVVRPTRVVATPGGFVVEVEALNRSDATAAGVRLEGVLKRGDFAVQASSATIDYVPGHARRRAGLIFARDPRSHRLELRAVGYQEP